jgi:hypothetical protein
MIPLVEVALAVIAASVVIHTGHIARFSDRFNAGDGNRKSDKCGAIPITRSRPRRLSYSGGQLELAAARRSEAEARMASLAS